jgi:SPP1 gp7 family putative phage head morphogenesis protein
MAAPLPKPDETFEAYRRVQRATDAEVLRILTDAYLATSRDLQGLNRNLKTAEVRRAKMVQIKAEVLRRQAEIFRKIGNVVEARRAQAAARALESAAKYDQALFDAIGRSDTGRAVARGLQEANLQNIDVAIARIEGSRTSLSQRVYRTEAYSSGLLERRINSALARGLSAQEFAREVRDLVNPKTPGGVRYAALRLARTEIANAYHALSIQAAMQKPWIEKMEWHLSNRHGRTDVCNQLAGRTFAVAEVPKKPHPQCLCYVTPVIDTSDEGNDRFLDDLVNGNFDEFLDEFADRQGLAKKTAKKVAPTPPPSPTPPAKKTAPAKKASPRKAAKPKVVVPSREIDGITVPDLGHAPSDKTVARITKLISDPETKRRIQAVFNRQAVLTPNTIKKLKKIVIAELGEPTWLAIYKPDKQEIQMAPHVMPQPAEYHRRMQERGWFTPCGHDHGSAEATAAHEYGHHVHFTMLHDTLGFAGVARRETAGLVSLMRTEFGITDLPKDFHPYGPGMKKFFEDNKAIIKKYVSEYGTTNVLEMCAEVWAEYTTNPNPRPHIKKLGDYMRRAAEANATR